MIKVICVKNVTNKTIDITNIIKNDMKLKKSINEFAWVLDFSITKNKDFFNIDIGDVMVVKHQTQEIFSGIVLSGNTTTLSFKAIDYTFYFAQNKEIYQFENVESSIVVQKIIESLGGKIGEIEATNTMVDTFYFNKTLGDIIKEIINNIKGLENQDFRFFYKNGTFNFKRSEKNKYLRKEYTPKDYLKSILNDYTFNALTYIEEPLKNRSMEKLRNSIKVYKNKGNEYTQLGEAKDSDSIKKYGIIQDIISVKENEINTAKARAGNILKDKNKITEKISVKIPVLSEFLYPGELLKLKYTDYDIDGVYEVESISYTIDIKKFFKANIELLKVEEEG